MKYYTGIGSRETPEDVLLIMTKIATKLEKQDYWLRTGDASGADEAFAKGCKNKTIFKASDAANDDLALTLAEKYHPAWHKNSDYAKLLHARNVYQVIGTNFITLSEFVICWTKNGSGKGGTGQAIRIAKDYNIPVYDLGNIEIFKVFSL